MDFRIKAGAPTFRGWRGLGEQQSRLWDGWRGRRTSYWVQGTFINIISPNSDVYWMSLCLENPCPLPPGLWLCWVTRSPAPVHSCFVKDACLGQCNPLCQQFRILSLHLPGNWIFNFNQMNQMKKNAWSGSIKTQVIKNIWNLCLPFKGICCHS